ncbi:hypothetical protein [Paenibacillus sp. NEAU-GSW1]|uniref:hypothetical protein n=1 Tax=Paenibacillus sp. NEAU-GSW1 TaxID=2682486 RepID=UPI0012E1D2EF|nr:hypothetical protein [Paenibacillus sp. NEAU-GSW1]MUT64895.1 hypothetical protein [Paenibacillus sp. NEAU-GSW1]
MATLLGILLMIFLIYRLYKLVRMLMMPQFWLGLVLNVVYFYLVGLLFSAFDEITFGAVVGVGFSALLLLVVFAMIIKPMRLPLYFVLGIVTLGLLVVNIDFDFDAGGSDIAMPLDAIPQTNELAVAMANDPGAASVSNGDNLHHVAPHWVDGYVRDDGTFVQGYWRDGDGNSLTSLSEGEGGGYSRSNPDGTILNNLKKGT